MRAKKFRFAIKGDKSLISFDIEKTNDLSPFDSTEIKTIWNNGIA